MKKIISLFLSVLLIISVLSVSFSANAEDTVAVKLTGTYHQTEARKLLSLVNSFRKSSDAWYINSDNITKTYCTGLSNLTYDYELEKAAMLRAAEITVVFDHVRPNGKSCFTVSDSVYGENIAFGVSTASDALELWKEDGENYDNQGHRRAILSGDFKTVGIACFEFKGTDFWVLEFGCANSGKPATAANNSETSVSFEILKSELTEELSEYISDDIKTPETDTIAVDGDGMYNKEGEKTAKAKPTKIKKIKRLKKGFKIKMKKISGVNGYQIKYSLKKNFKKAGKINTKKTIKTVKGLKRGKNYYVKVRTYKYVNGKKTYSKWSKVKKVKTK